LEVHEQSQRHAARVQWSCAPESPYWGSRRLLAYLRCVEPLPVHQQRSLRLLREPKLLVFSQLRLKAQRTRTKSTPQPTRLDAWWGIDRTTVLVPGGGRGLPRRGAGLGYEDDRR
jgi:hypothetical protein